MSTIAIFEFILFFLNILKATWLLTVKSVQKMFLEKKKSSWEP